MRKHESARSKLNVAQGSSECRIAEYPFITWALAIVLSLLAGFAAVAQTSWGLVIGVSDYEHDMWDLQYAAADATAFSEALVEQCGIPPQNVTTLIDAEATYNRVIGALRSLSASVGAEDTVIIYFSGHGSNIPDSGTAENEDDGDDETLVLHEARFAQTSSEALEGQLIDDELSYWVSRMRSSAVLIILDACHSGGVGKSAKTIEYGQKELDAGGDFRDIFGEGETGSGRAILTACQADEKAYENHDLKHGVFTYFLLRVLNREDLDAANLGVVTVSKLHTILQKRMLEWIDISGNAQHPYYRNELERDIALTPIGDPPDAQLCVELENGELDLGSELSAKAFEIRNCGDLGSELSLKVEALEGGTAHGVKWLESVQFDLEGVLQSGESSPVAVGVRRGGLEVGEYEAVLGIISLKSNEILQSVHVSIEVVSDPTLYVSTSRLTFEKGDLEQRLYISNAGTGVLPFRVAADKPWISSVPNAGVCAENPTEVVIVLTPTLVPLEGDTSTLTISSMTTEDERDVLVVAHSQRGEGEIEILAPSAGELWRPEEAHGIYWESKDISADTSQRVELSYSIDGGESWRELATAINDGAYEWSIPSGIDSERCVIRVSSAEDPGVFGVSPIFRVNPLVMYTSTDVSVLVLNGNSHDPRAQLVSAALQEAGFTVTGTGAAHRLDYERSIVIVLSDIEKAEILAEYLDELNEQIESGSPEVYRVDYEEIQHDIPQDTDLVLVLGGPVEPPARPCLRVDLPDNVIEMNSFTTSADLDLWNCGERDLLVRASGNEGWIELEDPLVQIDAGDHATLSIKKDRSLLPPGSYNSSLLLEAADLDESVIVLVTASSRWCGVVEPLGMTWIYDGVRSTWRLGRRTGAGILGDNFLLGIRRAHFQLGSSLSLDLWSLDCAYDSAGSPVPFKGHWGFSWSCGASVGGANWNSAVSNLTVVDTFGCGAFASIRWSTTAGSGVIGEVRYSAFPFEGVGSISFSLSGQLGF